MAASSPSASAPSPAAGDWVVWQMIDSLYPTGGFAHSLGLEAAVQEKIVRPDDATGDSLRRFLEATVQQAANFALPIVFSSASAVVAAQQVGGDDEGLVPRLLEINARAVALITNHVARKASFAQGAAMLRLAISTYDQDRIQALAALRRESRRRKQAGIHHPVVFGAVCGLLGLGVETSQRMFLFCVLRDTLSAATRLNLIGPMEAARIQFEFAPTLEGVLEAKKNRPIEASYSSEPILDLIQGMHDQLYTRIFNS